MSRTGDLFIAALFCCCLWGYSESVYQEEPCTGLGGRCMVTSGSCCLNDNYLSGKCPTQPGNVKCCMSVGTPGAYQEEPCTGQDGKCMKTTYNCCPDNNYVSGQCPSQAWNVKCCHGLGSPTTTTQAPCRLETYTYEGTQFFHASETSATIDGDFRAVMDLLNSYATTCNVKVYVTSSFRAQPVQAPTSCHMIGHAIDMNLLDVATNNFCISTCLQTYYPSSSNNDGINCFLQSVMGNSNLRWLASINDPVHIDDGICANQPSLWDDIRAEILANCDI